MGLLNRERSANMWYFYSEDEEEMEEEVKEPDFVIDPYTGEKLCSKTLIPLDKKVDFSNKKIL